MEKLMQPAKPVLVKNVWTDEYITYSSIKAATYQLRCSQQTLMLSSQGKKTIGGKFIVVNVG
jgi:hypothetical protein